MSNPFGKVLGFIKHAAVFVSHAFVGLFGHDAAAAFGHASLGVLDSALGKIVVKAVGAVQSLSPALDGGTKRAQAFSAVVNEAKTQGIGVTNSIVNLLIELAVSSLQGAFKPAPPDSVVVKFADSADPEIGADMPGPSGFESGSESSNAGNSGTEEDEQK